MLVLDENIPAPQQSLLRKWGIRFRVVGVDLAASGTTDENLIPLLNTLPQPTFFSQDAGFFRRALCHSNYALAFVDDTEAETADLIRRFLKHPLFDTQAARMGIVARLRQSGIAYYRKGTTGLKAEQWIDAG